MEATYLQCERKSEGSPTFVAPVPQRTKYEDLVNVTRTSAASAGKDPLYNYIYEHPITSRWKMRLSRILDSMALSSFVELKTAWVVDSGDAFIFFSDPAKPNKRRHKVVYNFAAFLGDLVVRSAEQRRRGKEFEEKIHAAIKEVLGDSAKEMFYLDHLATTPAKQGHGYGTALCRVFNGEADARGLASFVVSSNVEVNTPFYNDVGFYTVKEVVLGEHDSSWTKPPVSIAIMVRERP